MAELLEIIVNWIQYRKVEGLWPRM